MSEWRIAFGIAGVLWINYGASICLKLDNNVPLFVLHACFGLSMLVYASLPGKKS